MVEYVLRMIVLFAAGAAVCRGQTDQEMVDYLASNLLVEYNVINNTAVGDINNQWSGEMFLTNSGESDVTSLSWQIFFCCIRLMEYDTLRPGTDVGAELGDSDIEVYHVDGCLHKLQPTAEFAGLPAGDRLRLPFTASDWMVSRTDGMPRWYVTTASNTTLPRVITSTTSETLDFVGDFTSPAQWKRRPEDLYNPYTPEQRFNETGVEDVGQPVKPIVPTPVAYIPTGQGSIRLDTGDWVVVYRSDDVIAEAEYLAEQLGTVAVSADFTPSSRYVSMEAIDGIVAPSNNSEAYLLGVSAESETVGLIGNSPSAVFYAAQSLLSLIALDGSVDSCQVLDFPRFGYRGMHVDVGRNFRDKETILQLLDVMAMYKLNKLYFHLTEDEGWRLEIPGLPELTQVGARQCHDLSERLCILPQLGAGPTGLTSGTGHYTVADYREILRYAAARHIEVIPEFDSPGHAHAAIRAMEARAANGSAEYLLSDPDDASDYISVQHFRHNAINPCLQTTYDFFSKVIDEVIIMHQDIQPLRYFNFGGDETPEGAWEGSPACDQYSTDNGIEKTRDALKEWFAVQLAALAHEKGLDFGGWEDGLMEGEQPYNRSQFPNEEVLGWAWNNVWEWGSGSRAYQLANDDYQVVLAHATHLYFDHPQEPDPEERGYYWATRVTDARKTFAYMPDDVYKNIDVSNFGEPLDGFCDLNECVPLDDDKRENILGIQGHLWSETQRLTSEFHGMVFPRLLMLAERAWHRAQWETMDDYEDALSADWRDMANTLGYKELARLDQLRISYHLPPPGARFDDDGSLEMSTMFPGLPLQYSTDGGDSWADYSAPVSFEPGTTLTLITRSSDRARESRRVTLVVPARNTTQSAADITCSHLLLLLTAAILLTVL